MITGKDFLQEEINLINKYVLASVPYSVLEQIFPLTENTINKLTIYCTVFRIINSSENYIKEEDLKKKLKELVENNKRIFEVGYGLLLEYENHKIAYGKHKRKNNIKIFLNNYDNYIQMNNLIDVFLLFIEKQTLYDLNKVTGINLSEQASEKFVEELRDVAN